MWEPIRNETGAIVDFEIIDCNERGAAIFGVNKDLLLSRKLSSFVSPQPYLQSILEQFRTAMESGFYEDDFKVPSMSVLKAEWLHRTMVRSENGLAVTLRDISDQKKHESELIRLATEDTLTGLPNRHWLINYLPKALEKAAVNATQVAVLVIDLDDFKHVNDSSGRATGDRLLQAIAVRLRSVLRPEDVCVRLGEDEFAVILENVASVDDVMHVASRTTQALHQPFDILQRKKPFSASIGISMFPADGNDAETLLKNADIAMYSAKAECRGKFRFYEYTLYERIKSRLDTEQELLHAIEEDHFVMYYQPRVDTVSGKLVGMEALVRWIHPERGLVPPNSFIPLAESTGIILPLGELVMDKVCAQMASWQTQQLPLVPISVNVSARQFNEGNVKDFVAACLHKHHIAAELIEIELTESVMTGDFDLVLAEINAISALGVKIHIDDFGTGYSSLALLHKLDMDVLKVDRAFTSQLGDGKDGEIFFAAIVSMAKALGMSVVAEGVETAEQLHILQTLGCDEIQGFFISKPLPAHEIPALMQKHVLLHPVHQPANAQRGKSA
jgi:diguanylate cyclase (GGDEF)-like protein